MYADMARSCRRAASLHGPIGFEKYRDDPVGFCRDVLGFEPWETVRSTGEVVGQTKVLEALVTDDSVSNPAGRAVGKSRGDGGAALWFAATRGKGARVILTAPTFKQVQQILWEEIRNLFHGAKQPIRGECAKMASTGIRLANGAQIIGLTAEKPEAFQGIRGREMLLIADEASGIDEDIFHVIDGNTAGGAKLLLTGNPTKSKGYFRESMRSPRFKCVQISSTDSPNVIAGEIVVRGLATREWVDERKREWGEDSPLYKIHVLGEVVEAEEGRLFSAELIAGAEARWSETLATGRLVIGIDPAGASGEGDESAFAVRRGLKVTKIHARRGLTEEGHLTEALGLIATQRGDSSETPLVVIDRDGLRRRSRLRAHVGLSDEPRRRLPTPRRARRREGSTQTLGLRSSTRRSLVRPRRCLPRGTHDPRRREALARARRTEGRAAYQRPIEGHEQRRSPPRARALARQGRRARAVMRRGSGVATRSTGGPTGANTPRSLPRATGAGNGSIRGA